MQLKTIYVRLIEGVMVRVPIKARKISEDQFKIVSHEDFDLEDATAIWEFFPGDIFKCKKDLERNIMVANELISSDFPDRRIHQLIFKIVEGMGKLDAKDLKEFEKEIKDLKDPNCSILQKKHPIVKKWIENFDS